MPFIDPNAANKQRLRRNQQRTKNANFSGNIALTSGGGLEYDGNGDIQTSAFTGDVTKAAGGTTLTLATVNANVGTFNTVTVNGKGLVTAASNTSYLTASNFVFNETPTGDLDSVDVTYTLANTPTTGTVQVYKNGLRLTLTTDYSVSGSVITFVVAPDPGDVIVADYLK